MAEARFVGIDLAWSTGWTGVAATDDSGRLLTSGRVRTDGEISAWLRALDGWVSVVAVDAPLVVPQETGQRPAERLIGRAFGRFGASAHAANRRLLGDLPRALRLAQAHGWSVDPSVRPGLRPGAGPTGCIEVYPHPALVGLFWLSYRLAYKKGSTDSRLPGFRTLMRLLESVPQLGLSGHPRWREIHAAVESAGRGVVGRYEDEVDAILCAHLAWLWQHQPDALRVYGSLEDGYIVAPPAPPGPPVTPATASRPGA